MQCVRADPMMRSYQTRASSSCREHDAMMMCAHRRVREITLGCGRLRRYVSRRRCRHWDGGVVSCSSRSSSSSLSDIEEKIVSGEESSTLRHRTGSQAGAQQDGDHKREIDGGELSSVSPPPPPSVPFARLDISRTKRTGVPEAIFCPGKTSAQVVDLLRRIVSVRSDSSSGAAKATTNEDDGSYAAVATRMDAAMAEEVCEQIPMLRYHANCNIAILWRYDWQRYHDRSTDTPTPPPPDSGTSFLSTNQDIDDADVENRVSFVPSGNYISQSLAIEGSVGIISAGTADQRVALEAMCIAEVYGIRDVAWYCDVGVAGLHRLIGELDNIRRHDVVVVVAGMDGALPSVLAGLIDAPVIAVPTSVGYGANLGGISAMLTSLNSCAPGVSVVNVDNGFGAATCAIKVRYVSEN